MQWSRTTVRRNGADTTNQALDIFAIGKVLWDMFYFYILECANSKRYYGYTSNLKQRLSEHHDGKNRATRSRRPLKLVYYEECDSKSDAIRRKRQFKQGRTRKSTIDKLLDEFPADRLSEFQ